MSEIKKLKNRIQQLESNEIKIPKWWSQKDENINYNKPTKWHRWAWKDTFRYILIFFHYFL